MVLNTLYKYIVFNVLMSTYHFLYLSYWIKMYTLLD